MPEHAVCLSPGSAAACAVKPANRPSRNCGCSAPRFGPLRASRASRRKVHVVNRIFFHLPLPPTDVADHGLTAFIDRHPLDDDALFPFAPVAFQCFYMGSESTGEAVHAALERLQLDGSINVPLSLDLAEFDSAELVLTP